MDRSAAEDQLLEEVKRFYRSRDGKNLHASDWHSFCSAVEAYNISTNNAFLCLGKQSAPKILFESSTVLAEMVKKVMEKGSPWSGYVTRYSDFVFQLLTRPIKNPKFLSLVNGVLTTWNLQMGRDLSPYEEELNRFRVVEPFTCFGGLVEDIDTDLCHGTSYTFRCDGPLNLVQTFENQRWSVHFLDFTVECPLRKDLYNKLAEELVRRWTLDRIKYQTAPFSIITRRRYEDHGALTEILWAR